MNHINWQPGMTLEYIEKSAILQAFRHFGGVQTTTAQALGITSRTLYNKLQQYGMKGLDNKNAESSGHKVARYDGFGRLSGEYALDNPNRVGASDGASGTTEDDGGNDSATGNGPEVVTEGPAQSNQQGQTEGPSAVSVQDQTGMGSQPVVGMATQQPVPVQQRPEIQKVLPKQNAASSPRRR